MNPPTSSVPREYFIITDGGEAGPFEIQILNRMFSKGEIQGSQMCRCDGATEIRRLDEVFRHMGTSQAVTATARAKVAAYNVKGGLVGIGVGTALLLVCVASLLMTGRLLIKTMIAGLILFTAGLPQLRKGKALHETLPCKSESESDLPESPSKASKYDY